MHHRIAPARRYVLTVFAALLAALAAAPLTAQAAPSTSPLGEILDRIQPRIVKIHGAGGFRGMEPYQSGFLISAQGHILTVFSYVLDTEYVTVTLDDGRKFDARLVGAHPRLEMAVLKIDAENLPYFDLDQAVEAQPGTRVLALSNLFGVATGNEPASVQHGIVSVVAPLDARRGVFETPYRGPVYVLDAMTNNPGAAGGALVTRQGQLAGMLGKELRNTLNNTWLNYAVPIGELRQPVKEILAGRFVAEPEEQRKTPGRSITLADLGVTLVPDVLQRTPPYVEAVRADSPAARAGVKPDDLVILVGDRLIQSSEALRDELKHVAPEDAVRLSVLRGQDVQEFTLKKE
jgi:S1-C subfamily serine protease